MKKVVTFILVLVVFVFGSAYAETTIIDEAFSIRNGISFGMSIEEIQKIEEANQNVMLSSAELDGYTKELFTRYNAGCNTRMAGEGCVLLYRIDETDGLAELKYIFSSEETHNAVKKSLTEKYGPTETRKQLPPFEFSAFTANLDVINYLNPYIKVSQLWLVQYEDCFAMIMASKMEMEGVPTIYQVDYALYSLDEAAAVLTVDELHNQEAQRTLDEGL